MTLFRNQGDEELREEINAHIEQRTEALMAGGASPEEARSQALREFGNVTLTLERSRDIWRWSALDDFLHDLRYACRTFRRSPGFAATAVVCLALGIGSSTAIFSLIYGILLRPLPYRLPQQLVVIWNSPHRDQSTKMFATFRDFENWRVHARSLSDLAADVAVLAFAVGLAGLTTMLFGFVPAWKTSGCSLNNLLKSGTRAVPGSRRMRAVLAGAEVAFSVALLVAAGLLIQSVRMFASAPLGFDPNQLFRISIGASHRLNPEQRNAFYRDLLNDAKALAGPGGASLSTATPVRGGQGANILLVEGRPEPAPEIAVSEIAQRSISEEYFRCLAMPLRRGRIFTERDSARAPGVAIVNEQLAAKYFGAADPLGQRVRIFGQPEWLTVVGVASGELGATPFQEMGWASPPIVYRPIEQRAPESANLLLRGAAAIRIQRTLQKRHPEAVISEPEPISAIIGTYFNYPRFRAVLAAAFAMIALVLAVTGLYGVLAQLVGQRTREIGLRMALGAQRAAVISMIVRHGMRLAIAGSMAGLILTWCITRFLTNLLYGVAPLDIATIAAVLIALLSASLLAVSVPAWRAASVDPVAALRED